MELRTIVFDDGKGTLAPLTDLRPAFDVRTGALTILERFRLRWRREPDALYVPDRIAPITRERHPGVLVNELPPGAGEFLLVNGRYAEMDPAIASALTTPGSTASTTTGDLVASRVRPEDVLTSLAAPRNASTVPGRAGHHPAATDRRLLERPWHARTVRDRCLDIDLALLARGEPAAPPEGVNRFGTSPLTLAPTARLYPGAILDLEAGPIVIAEHATIRPKATLIGPCYIGPNSTVLDGATIRPHTAIGPWCKVNGEIGGTIFQGYSNKAHDGYLGDSWVGEWVNLGAGTTNSNLLNTYGEIVAVAAPGGSYERTGEQFLGAIIGDHVKAAICTRIMTGSVLHTGGMFATTPPVSGCIPAFTWATDAGARPYRVDKFLEVMRAAMARRKITPTPAYEAAVRTLASGPTAAKPPAPSPSPTTGTPDSKS